MSSSSPRPSSHAVSKRLSNGLSSHHHTSHARPSSSSSETATLNPTSNIWSLMNYPIPRGKCNQKPGVLSATCPCLRFMLNPLQAASTFTCDGCGHHASFHSLKGAEEEEEELARSQGSRKREVVEIEDEEDADADDERRRKRITNGVAATPNGVGSGSAKRVRQ